MYKKSNFLLSGLISSFVFVSAIAKADGFDKFITVTFNKPVSSTFLKKLNELTNTKIVKTDKNTYKLVINGITSSDKLDRYAELFTIMKNVKEVSPLPKTKVSDQVNSYIYLRKDLPDYNKKTTTKEEDANQTNLEGNENTDVFSQPASTNYTLKFKPNIPQEDIDNLKLLAGVQSTYVKEKGIYEITIPEETDPEYAASVLKGSDLVSSFEAAVPKATPKPAKSTTDANKTTELNQLNQGLVTTIPINYQKEVKITFKIGEEDEIKWLQENFGAKIVSEAGFRSFVVRFPEGVNPNVAIRALNVCSAVSSAQIYGN